jgi:hypothetical protein
MALGESRARTSGSDRERQRFFSSVPLAVDNTAVRMAAPLEGRPAPLPLGSGGLATEGPKLGGRRQATVHPGLDCRKVVRRRPPWSRGWASARPVRGGRSARRKPRGSGIRRSVGCSFREVGCRSRRVAPSWRRRGEPRGKPRGRLVARRGGSTPDEGSFIASGDKGAGSGLANVKGSSI